MQKIFHFILFVFFVVNTISCSRSYMVKTKSNNFVVERVNILAVAYHRPDYAPTDHDDFKVKNKVLSCQHPHELWDEFINKNSKSVIGCLNSIKDGRAVFYYRPDVQPFLELDPEEESNPKCLKSTLNKIPLPREIYYLGKPDGCYSSSFSVNTNQIMMTPTGFLKKKIVLPFPLNRPLKSIHELSTWFILTTFIILKNDEQSDGKLLATPVPDSICNSCFKNDALFKDKRSGKLKPIFWP